jgi:hypothetical protein
MQELGIPTDLFKNSKLLTRAKKNKSRIRNKVRRLRKLSISSLKKKATTIKTKTATNAAKGK